MNSVRDLITFRNKKQVYWISPYDMVSDAIKKMSEHNLGALVVLDNDEIVGLFSERDYARKLLLKGKSSLLTPIYEAMITKVIYVTQDYLLEDCMALMTTKHIQYLPVLEDGKVIDFISLEDITES